MRPSLFGDFLVATTLTNFCWAAVRANNSDPTVDLGYAKYRGLYDPVLSVNSFFGIPFAQPPIGPLRWKAPKPLDTTTTQTKNIINATAPGPVCVQGYPAWTVGLIPPTPSTGAEDCLLVNVIQPSNATSYGGLPVLVWIHGGGYTTGDANSPSGYELVKHSKNSIIFVSIQYRLGAYGFLGSKAYAAGGGAPNVGLLDQRAGLEWVHSHVSAFGGDPNKITIFGGSAGGGSVTNQMILYGGVKNPPFRAAIPEYPWWQQYLREEQLEKQYGYLLKATNCSSVDCLRGVPSETLKNATMGTYTTAYVEGQYGFGTFYYGPYVDGKVIQHLPSQEFKNGHFTRVPVLVDRDMYEGIVFTNASLTSEDEEDQDLKAQFPYATEGFFKELYDLYPSSEFNSTIWQRQTWFGDFTINCPTYFVASSLSSFGVKAWKLIFNAGSKTHGATGAFLFGFNFAPPPVQNVTIANVMKDWFVSFAVHLDPNAESWSNVPKASWPTYNKASAAMMVNDTEIGVVSDKAYDRSDRCDFLWENSDVVQNK